MKTQIKLVILLVLLGSGFLLAQSTGKIYGKIIDAKSGSPLPGANVMLKGTKLGAATDPEGNYFIVNIPPGNYTMRSMFIGFKEVEKQNINVEAGKATKVNFNLESNSKFEMDEKLEQFYLQPLPENVQKDLAKLKAENKIEYQKKLIQISLKYQSQKSGGKNYTESLGKIKEKIDQLVEKYKTVNDQDKRKVIEGNVRELLLKQYELREEKMQSEISKLAEGIQKLKYELQLYREEKDKIINKQLESILDK